MIRTLLAILILVSVSACASTLPTPTLAPAPKIVVEGAWGRPSPKMAGTGAFYMTIRNTGTVADKLVGAKSDACGTVELHESYQMPDGTMGMRMVAGGAIDIPAGDTVELKVGGLHVMCIEKKVDLTKGIKIPLTLVFEKSGEMNIEVEIREPEGM